MSQKALECSWVVSRPSGSHKAMMSPVRVIYCHTPAECLLPSLVGGFWLKPSAHDEQQSQDALQGAGALPESKWETQWHPTPFHEVLLPKVGTRGQDAAPHGTSQGRISLSGSAMADLPPCCLVYNHRVCWGEMMDMLRLGMGHPTQTTVTDRSQPWLAKSALHLEESVRSSHRLSAHIVGFIRFTFIDI